MGSFGVGAGTGSFGIPSQPGGVGTFLSNPYCNPCLPGPSVEEGWPWWVTKRGCGILSMLSLNERSYGLSGVVTPENLKYIADCMEKKGKKPWPRRGDPGHVDALLDCKTHLMQEKYDLEVDPKDFEPGPSSISAVDCPPLCEKQIITIAHRHHQTVYIWEHSNWTFLAGMKKLGTGETWHAITCEVISCDPPDISQGVCLECKDAGPQAKVGETTTLCIDKEGNVTNLNIKLSNGDTIGPPGSCAKKMQDPSYRKAHQGAPVMSTGTLGKFCIEQAKPGAKIPKPIVTLVITEAPCPGEDEEKKEEEDVGVTTP